MAKKRKEQARVLAQKQLASGIYDCLLETTLAKEAKPGQFVSRFIRRIKAPCFPAPSASARRTRKGIRCASCTG